FGSSNHCHLTIFEIDHVVGEFDERGSVGSNEIFLFSNSDSQRTSQTGNHQFVGLPLVENSNGISPHRLIQGDLNRFSKSYVLFLNNIFNKVHKDLCVGVRVKFEASGGKLLFQRLIVLNDPVVNDGQIS